MSLLFSSRGHDRCLKQAGLGCAAFPMDARVCWNFLWTNNVLAQHFELAGLSLQARVDLFWLIYLQAGPCRGLSEDSAPLK